MIRNEPVEVNGDGETSRDFCYVANVVQANILAGLTERAEALDQAYNVALQARTTLNELFGILREQLSRSYPWVKSIRPQYQDFRPGDVRHSLADISKAQRLLGYEPSHSLAEGLSEAIAWYCRRLAPAVEPVTRGPALVA